MAGTRITTPKSTYIKTFEWLGDRISYPEVEVKGDTWPLTWADDGDLYSSCGDPCWEGKENGLAMVRIRGMAPDYHVEKLHLMPDYVGGGAWGPKPSGMLCVEGVLYLAVQNMLGFRPPMRGECQHGSDAQILRSSDHGRTWTPAFQDIQTPMFPGAAFGGPAFINFGRNNENCRDRFVYAVSGDQWNNGTDLRLGRVPADEIMDSTAWQWVGGWSANDDPVWANRLESAVSILSEPCSIGFPDMVYVAAIERYLLFTWRLYEDSLFRAYDQGTDLIIFEAPQPWGPFSLVHYEEYWEDKIFTPYNPRLPLKWLAQDAGGVSGYLLFSGSWGDTTMRPMYGDIAPTPFYRTNIRPFRLTMR